MVMHGPTDRCGTGSDGAATTTEPGARVDRDGRHGLRCHNRFSGAGAGCGGTRPHRTHRFWVVPHARLDDGPGLDATTLATLFCTAPMRRDRYATGNSMNAGEHDQPRSCIPRYDVAFRADNQLCPAAA